MTDWDKELAKIDKQLAKMGDDELVAPSPARPSLPAGPAKGGQKAAHAHAPATADVGSAPLTRAAKFGLYGRVGLSVALAVGMMFWPYDAKCGAGVALYLGAVIAVLVSSVWSAVWSWRHRAARLHTLSLLLLTWGLVLGAVDILPRVGYAKPTLLHPAAWACK
jgi:putative flippase GtrA